MSESLFERYGPWPERALLIPDPNAPRKGETLTRPSTCRTSKGGLTVMVLAEGDALEIERAGLGL